MPCRWAAKTCGLFLTLTIWPPWKPTLRSSSSTGNLLATPSSRPVDAALKPARAGWIFPWRSACRRSCPSSSTNSLLTPVQQKTTFRRLMRWTAISIISTPPLKTCTMVDQRLSILDRLRGYAPGKRCVIEPEAEGRITRSVGMTLEAVGLNVSVGRQCEVVTAENRRIEAEVVGFAGDKVFLMPIKRVDGLQPGARVIPISAQQGMRI